MDAFRLQVNLQIKPLWMVPETTTVQRLMREQSEARMDAFAHELADFIADNLQHKTAEEWAEASYRLRKYFMER